MQGARSADLEFLGGFITEPESFRVYRVWGSGVWGFMGIAPNGKSLISEIQDLKSQMNPPKP